MCVRACVRGCECLCVREGNTYGDVCICVHSFIRGVCACVSLQAYVDSGMFVHVCLRVHMYVSMKGRVCVCK